MMYKIALSLLVILISQANSQSTSVLIAPSSNFSIPQTCLTGNVLISLEFRSTGTINFWTFDNLAGTCQPLTLPNPYPTLSVGSSIILIGSQLTGCTNPSICLAFINPSSSTAVTVYYQMKYECKVQYCGLPPEDEIVTNE